MSLTLESLKEQFQGAFWKWDHTVHFSGFKLKLQWRICLERREQRSGKQNTGWSSQFLSTDARKKDLLLVGPITDAQRSLLFCDSWWMWLGLSSDYYTFFHSGHTSSTMLEGTFHCQYLRQQSLRTSTLDHLTQGQLTPVLLTSGHCHRAAVPQCGSYGSQDAGIPALWCQKPKPARLNMFGDRVWMWNLNVFIYTYIIYIMKYNFWMVTPCNISPNL